MRLTALLLAGLAAALMSGCGDTSKPGTPANTVSNAVTAPVNYLGAAVQAGNFAQKQIDLASIKQAIQQFQASEGRLPASLQELVDARFLGRLPVAPAGYRIVYDPAKGTVQALKQ